MLNAASQNKTMNGSLTAASAIRIAWITWLTLLIIPFAVFLYIVWKFSNGETTVRHNEGDIWFLVSALYLLAVVPLSFFWRAHLFKSYDAGHPVHPHKYLFGMMAVWMALEIGGLFSLTGCLIYDSLLPDLIPALVAFMFFVTFWPGGRAMTHHVGTSQDPEVYQTPR
jgi:hypothetical protein